MDPKIKSIIQSKKEKHEKLSAILHYLFVTVAGISQSKYYILGSYALRESRNISDLDINLDHEEFFKVKSLIDRGMGKLEIYNNQIRWFYDMTKEYNKLTKLRESDFSIEAFQKAPNVGFPNAKFSLSSLRKKNQLDVDANKHQYFSMKTLLLWKKTMNREKDKPDIELIQKLLAKRAKVRN